MGADYDVDATPGFRTGGFEFYSAGWIPVDPVTLATAYPNVYAIGDVTSLAGPKAGVFAERPAAALASHLVSEVTVAGASRPSTLDRIDALNGTGDQQTFAATRRARWFGP